MSIKHSTDYITRSKIHICNNAFHYERKLIEKDTKVIEMFEHNQEEALEELEELTQETVVSRINPETLEKKLTLDILDTDGFELVSGNLTTIIPVLESGLVVFIGDKDNYKNSIIIQQVNGIDVWYSNINNSNLKLYDYVEKGTLIGETINNELFLVFKKDGKAIDYKKYIK